MLWNHLPLVFCMVIIPKKLHLHLNVSLLGSGHRLLISLVCFFHAKLKTQRKIVADRLKALKWIAPSRAAQQHSLNVPYTISKNQSDTTTLVTNNRVSTTNGISHSSADVHVSTSKSSLSCYYNYYVNKAALRWLLNLLRQFANRKDNSATVCWFCCD